jgi:hypothetical protein
MQELHPDFKVFPTYSIILRECCWKEGVGCIHVAGLGLPALSRPQLGFLLLTTS